MSTDDISSNVAGPSSLSSAVAGLDLTGEMAQPATERELFESDDDDGDDESQVETRKRYRKRGGRKGRGRRNKEKKKAAKRERRELAQGKGQPAATAKAEQTSAAKEEAVGLEVQFPKWQLDLVDEYLVNPRAGYIQLRMTLYHRMLTGHEATGIARDPMACKLEMESVGDHLLIDRPETDGRYGQNGCWTAASYGVMYAIALEHTGDLMRAEAHLEKVCIRVGAPESYLTRADLQRSSVIGVR